MSPPLSQKDPSDKPTSISSTSTDFITRLTPYLPSNPPTTISTSQTYINRLASTSAHANLKDDLTILFQREKPNFPPLSAPSNPNLDTENLLTFIQTANINRLTTKITELNSIIIESSDFACAACWTPPTPSPSPSSPSSTQSQLQPPFTDPSRPAFTRFIRGINTALSHHLHPTLQPTHKQNYYALSMMARDSSHDRTHVPGAVRAVLSPILELAESEGVPVWLEAGSPRARDIYAHFGFVVVEVVRVEREVIDEVVREKGGEGLNGVGGEGEIDGGGAGAGAGGRGGRRGIDTWCMVKHPNQKKPISSERERKV